MPETTTPRLLTAVVLAAALLLAAGPAARAAETGDDQAAAAYRAAYSLILDEKWPEAGQAFADLVKRFPKGEWTDDAEFWACYARDRQGEAADKTFACYEELIRRYPDSEWSDDARRNLVALAKRLSAQGKPEFLDKVKRFRDDDSENDTLLAVLAALGHVGDDRSLDVIKQRIDATTDEAVRAQIVGVLADIDSPHAAEKLVELARRDQSPKVRAAAVEALRHREGAGALALFKELAVDPAQPSEVRVAAIEALADGEDPALVPFFKDLALKDAAAAPPAGRSHGEGEGDGDESIHARGAAEAITIMVRNRLMLDLSDSTPAIAEAALEALARIPGREALAAIEAVYAQGPGRPVREAALHACSSREDAESLALLTRVATTETDEELAVTAAEAIGGRQVPEAKKALVDLAWSAKGGRVRAAAAHALGNWEAGEAVAQLGALLRKAPDTAVRVAAAAALAHAKDAGIAPLLLAAQSDPSGEVRQAAVRALGDIGTPAARDALITLLGAKSGR